MAQLLFYFENLSSLVSFLLSVMIIYVWINWTKVVEYEAAKGKGTTENVNVCSEDIQRFDTAGR